MWHWNCSCPRKSIERCLSVLVFQCLSVSVPQCLTLGKERRTLDCMEALEHKDSADVILWHIGLLEADEDKIRPKGTLVTILYVHRDRPICHNKIQCRFGFMEHFLIWLEIPLGDNPFQQRLSIRDKTWLSFYGQFSEQSADPCTAHICQKRYRYPQFRSINGTTVQKCGFDLASRNNCGKGFLVSNEKICPPAPSQIQEELMGNESLKSREKGQIWGLGYFPGQWMGNIIS